MNLAYTLYRTARRLPRAIAVIERDRIELSYENLAARALALAGGLHAQGVRSGDRVGLLMKNCAQYVELLYACWTLGACAIPINARLHAREAAWILDDAHARLCFVTEEAGTTAIEEARASGRPEFVDVDGADYRRLLPGEAAVPRAESSANESAWLFYTSGTTGRPKGVLLTHRILLAMTLNYLADVDRAEVGDHLLHAAPMSHGSGLYTITNIAAGATQLIAHAQAYDDGIGNIWNSSGAPHGYGNYWSDWTGPDADMDGIVDVPYEIPGRTGAKDIFPQTTPQEPIPEFGMMSLVAAAMLVAIVLAIGARRGYVLRP